MKILIVCQFFYPEIFSINDVAKGLVKKGHEVLVVTGKPNYGYGRILDGYESVNDEMIDGVRVHRCPLRPRKKGRLSIIANYLSFWFHSRRYLKRLKEEFDVVYSMSLSPLISIVGGTIYARKHHVRHVLHCLDLWPEATVVTGAVRRHSLLYRVLFGWCKKIYANLDAILISSPSFKRYFHETLGVKNVPISYVPQPPQVSLPTREITYDHKFNFVYAGNIGTLQLVEEAVLATELVQDKIDVCLHILGMGARADAVCRLIEEHGLSKRVKYYGIRPREEVASYYQNATGIIVSLSHKGIVGDTIPNKLNSSLAYGKPILGVIQGDGARVLEEAEGAVLSHGETPNDIALAMLRLAQMDEKTRQKLGDNNAAYFKAHYELDGILDEIVNHLKK
ncbi:MAG: glycosyltransferase family 4 protein [Bacilli bacterium]|nr:glycosyltransferase family 4 protein [Bacilli bacterium]